MDYNEILATVKAEEAPVVDAPVVDVKTEEVKDVKEPVKEEVKTDEFSFDSFKSYAKAKYEKDINSEEDLVSYFEKAKKADELTQEVDGLTQKVSELTNLASKGISGREWFASDDEFIRQQFLTKRAGEYSEQAMKLLVNLSPEKVKNLDHVEAIKLSMMVENPDLEKSEVDELIAEEYGLNEDDELSGAAKAKIKVNGNNAKKTLAKLYDGIEIPKAVDWESGRAALKSAWESPLKDLVDGITELKLTEEFSFNVSPEMKAGMVEEALNEVLSSQTKVSEEAAGVIAGKVRSKILEKNFDKIVKVLTDEISEREKERWRKEVHNDTGVNNDSRAEGASDGVMTGAEWMKSL